MNEHVFLWCFEVFTYFERFTKDDFNLISDITKSWLVILLHKVVNIVEALTINAHVEHGHIVSPSRLLRSVDECVTSWSLKGDDEKVDVTSHVEFHLAGSINDNIKGKWEVEYKEFG